MAEAADAPLVVRSYQPSDREQVESFRCAPTGLKWCEAAEKVIREAPEALESGDYFAVIAVATLGETIVGVAVFGPDPSRPEHCLVYSIGVLVPLHRTGIGTRLKKAILAAAAGVTTPFEAVVSRVHRANYRIIRLNDKLGVGKDKDPEDGEYYLTAVVPVDEKA